MKLGLRLRAAMLVRLRGDDKMTFATKNPQYIQALCGLVVFEVIVFHSDKRFIPFGYLDWSEPTE